ncbi:MAG: hypothetical protein AB1651_13330 [Pseudomonadota bacterium]
MTDPRDSELQQYLAGHSRLSARYREASRESSPAELDDAVLAQARHALTRDRRGRRTGRWLVPLATAATLVLAVSLVLELRDQAVPPPPAQPAAPAPERAAAAQRESEPAGARETVAADATAERAATELRKSEARAQPPRAEADAMQAAPKAAREEPEAESVAAPRTRRAAPAAALLAPAAQTPAHGDEAVSTQARALGALLRAGDFDTLRTRYAAEALAPAALDAAAEALRGLSAEPRLRIVDDGAAQWRIDYLDENGRTRCTARLRHGDSGWQLLALQLP